MKEEASMRKFQITVNSQSYQVEVEEVAAFTSAPVAYSAPAPVATPAPAPVAAAPAPAAPAAEAAPAPAPAKKAGPVSGEVVKAPMPGTIVNVIAAEGAKVKKGEVVLILEAMKMENEILSPRDGVVTSIIAPKGSSVNSGDPMFALS
jgi:biotin carboxyl carrier protein